MSEDDTIAAYARSMELNPEMFARVVGDTPLWLGADPVGGRIILVRVLVGGTIVELARWTAVQGQNVKRLHDMALYIVSSGVGAMR